MQDVKKRLLETCYLRKALTLSALNLSLSTFHRCEIDVIATGSRLETVREDVAVIRCCRLRFLPLLFDFRPEVVAFGSMRNRHETQDATRRKPRDCLGNQDAGNCVLHR